MDRAPLAIDFVTPAPHRLTVEIAESLLTDDPEKKVPACGN